jgi:D-xylose transport system ATP-binding protein
VVAGDPIAEDAIATALGPILQVRGISKSYGGVRAVENVDLDLVPGEICALVGGNGAGKSTVVGMLSGAIRPDQGAIWIDGQSCSFQDPLDARAAGVETVFQGLSLIDTLDVAGNVFLGREVLRRPHLLRWLDESRMRSEAMALLAELQVSIDVGTPVLRLSGGQRQAVALARAIKFKAKVVILDEPTAALGLAETRATLEVVRQFRREHHAVLMVSHDLGHVFDVADRIIVMKQGQVVGIRRVAETDEAEVLNLVMLGVSSHPPEPRFLS